MKKIIVVFLFSLILIPFYGALAVGSDNSTGVTANANITPGAGVNLKNPIKVNSPQQLIGQVINSVLGIVGSIALLMFIWGGFLWMTAAGNDEKIQQGKKTLTWSALGLVVIFSSYALVSYLIKNIVAGK